MLQAALDPGLKLEVPYGRRDIKLGSSCKSSAMPPLSPYVL